MLGKSALALYHVHVDTTKLGSFFFSCNLQMFKAALLSLTGMALKPPTFKAHFSGLICDLHSLHQHVWKRRARRLIWVGYFWFQPVPSSIGRSHFTFYPAHLKSSKVFTFITAASCMNNYPVSESSITLSPAPTLHLQTITLSFLNCSFFPPHYSSATDHCSYTTTSCVVNLDIFISLALWFPKL